MPRILFIRYKRSNGVLEGGEVCSEQHLKALQQHAGAENVDVVFIHDEKQPHSRADYALGGLWMGAGYHFGLNPRKVKQIVAKAKDYDILWIDRSVFGILAKKARQDGFKGKIICFFHNVEKEYFAAKYKGKPWKWFIAHCADLNDRYACRYADKIVCLNGRDRSRISQLYGRQADALMPILCEDRLIVPVEKKYTENPLRCMFLGSWFPANVEGLKWFLQRVYPKVDIELTIIGKGMEAVRKEPWCPQKVNVIGRVEAVDPFMMATDLMILPIFSGSGMKVKTCESLMFGRNILGTREAFEGYDVDPEKVGACCETVEEFVKAIKAIGARPRPRFNEYSREVFLRNYSSSCAQSLLKEILL